VFEVRKLTAKEQNKEWQNCLLNCGWTEPSQTVGIPVGIPATLGLWAGGFICPGSTDVQPCSYIKTGSSINKSQKTSENIRTRKQHIYST